MSLFNTTEAIVTVKVGKDFTPKVAFGNRVKPGTTLGTGTATKVLEEYPLSSKTKILVEDGAFVTPGTPLLEEDTLLEAVTVFSQNHGIIKIQRGKLLVTQVVEDHTFKSPVRGIVRSITPSKVLIETRFFEIPTMWRHITRDVSAPLQSIILQDAIVTSKQIGKLAGADIVVISSPITYKLVREAFRLGVKTLVGPSISPADIKAITKDALGINVLILQRIGYQLMWEPYQEFFKQAVGHWSAVSKKSNKMLVTHFKPQVDTNFVYVFSPPNWAKEVPLVLGRTPETSVKEYAQDSGVSFSEVLIF